MFGIIEKYHCWPLHGSTWSMQDPEIVGLINFWTRMNNDYFLRSWIPKIYHQLMGSVVRRVCFSDDFTINAVVGFLHKLAWEMCHTLKHFNHMQCLICWLVLLFYMLILLALVWEPRQCSLFRDYIPESKFCLCIHLRHPPGPSAIRRIGNLPNC